MVEEIKKEEFKFDANTVLYILYLLYKANFLTRHNLRSMIRSVKDQVPGDIVKFLVEEAGKAT